MRNQAEQLLAPWQGGHNCQRALWRAGIPLCVKVAAPQEDEAVECFCRIGTYFGSAHAGQTAEGDNSVLMQKVRIFLELC